MSWTLVSNLVFLLSATLGMSETFSKSFLPQNRIFQHLSDSWLVKYKFAHLCCSSWSTGFGLLGTIGICSPWNDSKYLVCLCSTLWQLIISVCIRHYLLLYSWKGLVNWRQNPRCSFGHGFLLSKKLVLVKDSVLLLGSLYPIFFFFFFSFP